MKNMRNHDVSELTEECNGTYVGELMLIVDCECKKERKNSKLLSPPLKEYDKII